MKNKKRILTVLLALFPFQSLGQTKIETGSGFDLKLSGLVDLYYLYNQNGYNLKPGADPTSTDDDYDTLTYRNYDDTHNDIVLNLLELTLEGQYKFLSFYADLDFGNFAEQNAPESSDGTTHQIGQAHVTYQKGPIQIRVGKMYTNIGYEAPKTIDNWNTSRSFAYMIGTPTWHEGVSVRHDYTNGVHWSLFLYDSFDPQRTDNNNQKTASLQVGWENENWVMAYNAMAGNESDRDAEASLQSALTQIHQAHVQYTLSDNWAFALSGLYAHDEDQASATGPEDAMWNQVSLYVHYEEESWSLSARGERIEFFGNLPLSEGGGDIEDDQLIFNSLTLTYGQSVAEKSELRFEYRSDQTNTPFYMQDNSVEDLVENQTTYSISWLLKF